MFYPLLIAKGSCIEKLKFDLITFDSLLKGLFTLGKSEGEDESEFTLEMVFVPIKQQVTISFSRWRSLSRNRP